MPMPICMSNALTVHLYMMNWLETHLVSYQEAFAEMERRFPGWWERDGDPMIASWIESHTNPSCTN